jgi:hypothetical protein
MPDTPSQPGPSAPRVYDSRWQVGTLLAHGPAPYAHDSNNSMSYFVRLRISESEEGARRRIQQADQEARPIDGRTPERRQTPEQGGVRTLWGTDLKRAIAQSKSHIKVGEVVAVRVVRNDPIGSVKNEKTGQSAPAYKKRFEVERPEFVLRRTQFARRVNETYQGARRAGVEGEEAFARYLIQDGAHRLAQVMYPDEADRQRFLRRVENFFEVSPDREAVIASVVSRINAQRQRPTGPRREASPDTRADPSTSHRPPRQRE